MPDRNDRPLDPAALAAEVRRAPLRARVQRLRRRFLRRVALVAAGAIVGAAGLLGYFLLVHGNYEASAVMKYETSAAGYRRLANIAFSQEGFNAWIAMRKTGVDSAAAAELRRILGESALTQQSIAPFFRVTKRDLRDMPPMKEEEQLLTQLLGVELRFAAMAPAEASGVVKLGASYLRDLALWDQASELVRSNLRKYSVELPRLESELLRGRFESDQLRTRVAQLKKISAEYPESSKLGDRQLLPVGEDARTNFFLPPLVQIVGAESELIDLRVKMEGQQRELEQTRVAATYYQRAIELVGEPSSGLQLLIALEALRDKVAGEFNASGSESIRQIVNQISGPLSELRVVLVNQPLFLTGDQVAVARVISPLKAALLGAAIGALLVLLAFVAPRLFAWLRVDPSGGGVS